MSKVIIFSRVFPAYHQKVGQPTYFVEKLWQSILDNELGEWQGVADTSSNSLLNDERRNFFSKQWDCKNHTIRAGHRFKVGDKFSPRVWSGKPYRSKQIIIAPDIEVKKVWTLEIFNEKIIIGGVWKELMDSRTKKVITELATNDGLSVNDFLEWFKYPKTKLIDDVQIICWNENIKY